jgi:hypothetical protein
MLADEQELVKLLVTLKCLLPVMRREKSTYLKRVVKEMWDELNRIEAGYDMSTNTAVLPTVNALFIIISAQFFLGTIDIVDFYLVPFSPFLNLFASALHSSPILYSNNLASSPTSTAPTTSS